MPRHRREPPVARASTSRRTLARTRRHPSPRARPRSQGGRFYLGKGGAFSPRGTLFISVKNGSLQVVTVNTRGDPAPGLLAWSKARAREIFPDGEPIARSEAATRLSAPSYAERAEGLGLATRAQPPSLDLLLAAARDVAYPDLRGAALLAAAERGTEDDDVRAAILELALDGDSGVRRTATGLLGKLGAAGARRAAEILLSGDYTDDVLPQLTAPVALHGNVAAFLGASPPPGAALSVVQQLAAQLSDPQSDDDRRLAQTLPQLVRPLLESPAADAPAAAILPQLAALGHGAFLRGIAAAPLYRDAVRSAAVLAALGDDATRADGIAATAAILTDPSASVALARGVLAAVDDSLLDDPTLRGALSAAARGHPSGWVRDDARDRLARHDPATRGTLVIHEAAYGAGDGWVDVTDALRGAIENGRLRIQAGNALAGDPKVGTPKTLRVEYSLGGERRLRTASEGAWLTIP